jgi:prepilin peptidase CpaA
MEISVALVTCTFALFAFAGFMIWAGVGDVRTFLITNKLNMLIAVTFLILCIPMGLGWNNILSHLKVGLITIVITIALSYFGVFGGGDAKMTGAAALWLGPTAILPFIIYFILAGGVLAITLIISRLFARRFGLPRSPKWARRLMRKRAGAPYGVALGIGALMAVPSTVWFSSTIFA